MFRHRMTLQQLTAATPDVAESSCSHSCNDNVCVAVTAHESSQTGSTRSPGRLADLYDLNYKQRQEYYKHKFSMPQRLEELSTPHLCEEYPSLGGEIFEAYISFTTFTVSIWANYDAVCKKFFMDPRKRDCGKLILTSSTVKRLQRLVLHSVRLDIGTPFTKLCHMSLNSSPARNVLCPSTVRLRLKDLTDGQHPEFRPWPYDAAICIRNHYRNKAQQGFTLQELQAIARLFLREPTTNEVEFRSSVNMALQRYDRSGWPSEDIVQDAIDETPWMDLEYNNEGHVDTKALWEEDDLVPKEEVSWSSPLWRR